MSKSLHSAATVVAEWPETDFTLGLLPWTRGKSGGEFESSPPRWRV
jgi:hypothetical protein